VFHVLTLTYLQPLDVIDKTRPDHVAWLQREIEGGGVLITADVSADEADDVVAGDPYSQAGLVRYERLGFNGAFRAPGL
jgi:uncharacterized protein YciI